jgi:hypothetical protein
VKLADMQVELARLIRGTDSPGATDDPYLQLVARSPHLILVRHVVRWWRAYGVGRYCVLTAELLKRRGLFDETISDFVRSTPVTPYAEQLGQTFLAYATKNADALVAAVASFELALVKAKSGDPAEHIIPWPVDPDVVLLWLTTADPKPLSAASGEYATVVSRSVANMFQVLEPAERAEPLKSS